MGDDEKSVLVFSSSEASEWATGFSRYLDDRGFKSRRWSNIERKSPFWLADLRDGVAESDFVVVLLTGDDGLSTRDEDVRAPRDNTVFELGLACGLLGLDRVAAVSDRSPVRILSNFDGFRRVVEDLSTEAGREKAAEAVATRFQNVRNTWWSGPWYQEIQQSGYDWDGFDCTRSFASLDYVELARGPHDSVEGRIKRLHTVGTTGLETNARVADATWTIAGQVTDANSNLLLTFVDADLEEPAPASRGVIALRIVSDQTVLEGAYLRTRTDASDKTMIVPRKLRWVRPESALGRELASTYEVQLATS